MNYYLLKSEPDVYSIDDLKRDKKTHWNGVRNYQARNTLRTCKKGDLVLIYHSNDDRAVVGVGEVSKEAYPDVDPKKPGDWVQIEVKFSQKLTTPVTLQQIKTISALKNIPLLKQSRLSCMQVSKAEFDTILKLGQSFRNYRKQEVLP